MGEAAPDVSTRYRAGQRFGQYEIRRFIRRGGMAEVYEAEHLGLRKRVAIKVLRAEAAENERIRKRFLREGERAARVEHPNIVDVTDVGEVESTPFLVMELLDGETLGDRLDIERRLDIETAIEVMVPVLAAVWAGHRQGVVHRDLKPDNIFLAKVGKHRIHAKVLDFGISRLVDEEETRLTLPETVVGTPAYLAPEQARGDDADETADQYALATVLYRAVTGGLPRRGGTVLKQLTNAANGEVIPPSHRLADIDPRLESVLLCALSNRPEDRFEDVGAFGRALLPFGNAVTRELWTTEFSANDSSSLVPAHSGERLTAPTADWGLPSVDESSSLPGIDDEDDAPRPSLRSTSPSDDDEIPPTHRSGSTTLGVQDTELDLEPKRPASSQGRRLPWIPLVAALGLVGLWGWFVTRPAAPAPTTTPAAPAAPAEYVVSLQVEPAKATIELDGAVLGQGTLTMALPKDGKLHNLVARLDGYEEARVNFRDAPPPSPLRLAPLPREPEAPERVAPEAAEPQGETRPAGAAPPAPRPKTPADPAWPAPGSDNVNPWEK